MKGWSILPAYLVRVAGFAFDRLAALRCPRAADAADALEDAAAARLAAGRALDEALAHARYADRSVLDPTARKALVRQVKQVRAFATRLSELPPPAEALRAVVQALPQLAAIGDELDRTHARWRTAAEVFAVELAGDLERARAALRQLYRDDRLQEAVFLQSPEAFDGIQHLLAGDGPRTAPVRRRERLAAMYAQRFCAKNDTNSICGPVGIAYLPPETAGAGGATLEITVEDARRETYFSHWAAQRLLAEAVRRAGDAAPVTLRLSPAARIDGDAVAWCVIDPTGATFGRRYARSALPPGGARLLRALARPRTSAELTAQAGELALDPDELAAFLDQLVDAGVVLRGPLLPPGLFHPLRAVAAEVERWPASDARTWALAEVVALEELIAAFARAPLTGRRELFQRLVARFVDATGDPARRGGGRHYADRTVLHEDCYVEVRSELGAARATLDRALPAVIAALELPLELARERVREWFRARFGAPARVPVLEVHRAFDGDRVLEAPASTPRAAALRTAIDRVREAIARAAAAASTGSLRLSADDLRGAIGDVAPPAHAGYVSADVMVRRGPSDGCELVLAEVHAFVWIPTCLVDILPPGDGRRVLDEMRAALRRMAGGRPTAECVFLHTQATDRRCPIAATDLQMIVPSDRLDAVDLGALDLRLTGDQFEFLHGDAPIVPLAAYTRYPFLLYTSPIAPLYDDFSEAFFPDSMLPAALRGHDAPRITVDDLVCRRRVWRRPAADVRAALAANSDAELFRRAQALRRELGCEARVFASLSGEPKPVLLDFHTLCLVEALVSLLHRQSDDAVVKISEMLPAPDELVARAGDGLRTSELRMGFYRSLTGD